MAVLAASELEETLEVLSEDAARAYINPLVSAFGADMNGGWFHRVPLPEVMKFDFELGIVAMGALFDKDEDAFDVTGTFSFTCEQALELTEGLSISPAHREALVNQIISQEFELGISGPTVIGPAYDEGTGANSILVEFGEQEITYTYNNQTFTETLPAQTVPLEVGGLLEDLPALPLAAPQLTLGTYYGTSFAFRFLPETEITPEVGKLAYWGFGLQHNPAVWFAEKLPVDIAAALYTQTLKVGNIMEAASLTYGVNVGKTWGPEWLHLTPYLGLAAESSSMKFKYDYPTGSTAPGIPQTIRIDFKVEGENNFRATTGLSIRLAILNFNFDYNFAKYPSATAGVMFNFSF